MLYTVLYSKAIRLDNCQKIRSFLVRLFGFLIFWTFSNILKSLKIIKVIYSYKLGGDKCQWENKLVPSSRIYLCSMQGHMCRIATLGGKSPPGKNRESSCKGYIKWLSMARQETISGYMAETQCQGSWHKSQ